MTGIIILAAGASGRLGKPKQNLIYKGKTLLQNAIDEAIASVCKPVIVVLGANADIIKPTIKTPGIIILLNENWPEGMASSIRLGISGLKKIEPKTSAAILILCDQPFVDAGLLNKLAKNKSGKKIAASSYNDTLGVPVLFGAAYFDELLRLKGDEGAKKILVKYPDDIFAVPFALGSVDIDTMDDYQRISNF